ncbi:MAG: hypothetical protein Aurels2KO_09160 [Aureliella sp.]
MKHINTTLIALTVVGCLANAHASYAQTNETDQHSLLSPSTVCVVKLTAESIKSPKGLFEIADFAPFIEAMQEYSGSQDVFITLGSPEARRSTPVRVYVQQQGRTVGDVSAAMEPHGFGPVEVSGNYFVMPLLPPSGPGFTQSSWKDDQERFAELDAAFDTVGDQAVQIAVLPPRHLWRTYREIQPVLPQEIGGGPSSLLTDGVTWAAIGIDPAGITLKFNIRSASDQAASALAKALPTWIGALAQTLPGVPAKSLEALLTNSKTRITPQGSGVVGSIALKNANPQAARETLRRILAPVGSRRKSDQLKQMMLAIHNYASANKYFPPGPKARGEDGKPWLSWRVHVLPFLGKEGQALWKEFHLDEPWDSEHNMTLLDKMPDIYALPSGILANKPIRSGHTTFQAPVADNTIAGQDKAITFRDMTDGTSNTISIVEVKPENAVPWTAPQDYEFDAENAGARLFVEADGKFSCAFADGSTHRLPADLSPKTIRDLFGMNDGQVTQLP